MLEALVSADLSVRIVDSPVPEPAAGDILIKVACAGVNPKDHKYATFSGIPSNSGDDIAGCVEKVGRGVWGFHKGDRVAAFHRMREPGGAFAEYAVAPASTTFHLPEFVSFEGVGRSSVISRSQLLS